MRKVLIGFAVLALAATVMAGVFSRSQRDTFTMNVGTDTTSAGWSTVTDTVPLGHTSNEALTVNGYYGWFKVYASPTTAHTIGTLDTGKIKIYCVSPGPAGDTWMLLDSSTTQNIPCSLHVARTGSTAGADTLFKGGLMAIVALKDSCNDTTVSVSYGFTANFNLTGVR